MNKICVYAICKNESKFVEAWIESMSEADYVVVLDTGSTDDTYEKLKGDSRIHKVSQQVISPWRFDVARNESMLLIPEDANILVCTDLDEVFEPGWAKTLRMNWQDDTQQCWYKYIWSHDDLGNPLRTMYYNKIHNRNWIWEFPVHETLKCKGKLINTVDLFNSITLHHYPDPDKSRGSYLNLLKLRVEENPSDTTGKLYYGRELFFYEKYEEAIEVLSELTSEYDDFSPEVKGFTWKIMAWCLYSLGYTERAIDYAATAIQICKEYRDPYLLIAQILNEKQMFSASLLVLRECETITQSFHSWIEDDYSWYGALEDLVSIALWNAGDRKGSYQYVKIAAEQQPGNKRIQENLKFIEAQLT